MQILEIKQTPVVSLPPIHTWPAPLKQVTLYLVIAACVGIYLLAFGGLVGAAILLLKLISN